MRSLNLAAERYAMAAQAYMVITKLANTYSGSGRPDSVRRLRVEAGIVLVELQPKGGK